VGQGRFSSRGRQAGSGAGAGYAGVPASHGQVGVRQAAPTGPHSGPLHLSLSGSGSNERLHSGTVPYPAPAPAPAPWSASPAAVPSPGQYQNSQGHPQQYPPHQYPPQQHQHQQQQYQGPQHQLTAAVSGQATHSSTRHRRTSSSTPSADSTRASHTSNSTPAQHPPYAQQQQTGAHSKRSAFWCTPGTTLPLPLCLRPTGPRYTRPLVLPLTLTTPSGHPLGQPTADRALEGPPLGLHPTAVPLGVTAYPRATHRALPLRQGHSAVRPLEQGWQGQLRGSGGVRGGPAPSSGAPAESLPGGAYGAPPGAPGAGAGAVPGPPVPRRQHPGPRQCGGSRGGGCSDGSCSGAHTGSGSGLGAGAGRRGRAGAGAVGQAGSECP